MTLKSYVNEEYFFLFYTFGLMCKSMVLTRVSFVLDTGAIANAFSQRMLMRGGCVKAPVRAAVAGGGSLRRPDRPES